MFTFIPSPHLLSPGFVSEGLQQNHYGPLVVLQTRPDHPGLHPTTVSGMPLRLSLLQPHSGVRISWDQRNPTGCLVCH